MNTLSFLKEFLKKGEISPRWASPPNRASSLPYEQLLSVFIFKLRVLETWKPGDVFKETEFYVISVFKISLEILKKKAW